MFVYFRVIFRNQLLGARGFYTFSSRWWLCTLRTLPWEGSQLSIQAIPVYAHLWSCAWERFWTAQAARNTGNRDQDFQNFLNAQLQIGLLQFKYLMSVDFSSVCCLGWQGMLLDCPFAWKLGLCVEVFWGVCYRCTKVTLGSRLPWELSLVCRVQTPRGFIPKAFGEQFWWNFGLKIDF